MINFEAKLVIFREQINTLYGHGYKFWLLVMTKNQYKNEVFVIINMLFNTQLKIIALTQVFKKNWTY
jgi:hypothetical protein